MKKNYKINYANKTITITKAFNELAQNPENEEYKLLMQFRKELRDFSIIMSAPKSKKKTKKITYDKMVKYIACQKDSTILLKQFAEIRELSKSTPAPYNFVYKWFTSTFPSYDKLPEFDSNGNTIPQYNLRTADPVLEEVTANVA